MIFTLKSIINFMLWSIRKMVDLLQHDRHKSDFILRPNIIPSGQIRTRPTADDRRIAISFKNSGDLACKNLIMTKK